MKKVIVIGCSGSGKSTFSKALSKATHIPLHHLDMMYWNSDRTTVGKDLFLERLSEAMKIDEWIIDGNYASTMDIRMSMCDTVFFLDYPLDVCIEGVTARRGQPRSDMPWIELEEDKEFMEFIKGFNANQRPQILELLNKYKDKNIVIFTERQQADDYLASTERISI